MIKKNDKRRKRQRQREGETRKTVVKRNIIDTERKTEDDSNEKQPIDKFSPMTSCMKISD